jgi:hypothetical protein
LRRCYRYSAIFNRFGSALALFRYSASAILYVVHYYNSAILPVVCCSPLFRYCYFTYSQL